MKEIQILNNGDALYDIRRKINENFELVHEKATTEPLVSFGVNEGNETDGVADLLNIDGDTLNFKVGGEYPNLVMTSGDGVTTKIESVNPLHLQNLADGEYKVVVDGSNSNITNAEFYSQLLEPENANNGDVWFNGESAFKLTPDSVDVKLMPNTNFSPSFFVKQGDTYIAGGYGYRVLRSMDGGATWTLISYDSEAENNTLVGGVYHNGAFYFVGTNQRVYKTETSGGWLNEPLIDVSVTVKKFKKVKNNLFVVLTNEGNLVYSSNMVNWNISRTLAGKNISDIVFLNDTYYAFLANGEIYTSTDFANWAIITTKISNPSCAFVYKNYILVGNQTGGITIYDPIKNTTELVQLPNNGKINHFHLRQDGGLLVLGSYNICSVTYDLKEFNQIYGTGGELTFGDDDFIVGTAGVLLKTTTMTQWVPYPYIPIGELTILGGEVTYFTTYPYNTNGLFEATTSTFGLLRTAAEPDELNCHCQEAVLTPANLYNLNNYRTMNTSYEVDQKVGCPYHHNLQLNCIQAGTTSNEGLNTKGLLEPGTTIEDGTVIWEVQELGTAGGGLPMFAHIWSDHIYKDASYLRADTFSWQDGRIYKTGYEILEEQYDNEDSVIEVEDGITYKRTPDGFKIADETQQDAIRSLYETKGIAWIYVIDKANKRFKLPREKAEFATTYPNTLPVVGNGMTLGLTNGSEYAGVYTGSGNDQRLHLTTEQYGAEVGADRVIGLFAQDLKVVGVTTDPTKSGIEAQVTGIQTERINTNAKKYLYFYIGAYKRPETELELGKITEVLNDLGDLKDVVLKKDQITNCITEIPQRIKYELVDGKLTVKAGSVVIVPFGTEDLTEQYPAGSMFLHEYFKVYDTQFADGKFFVWAEVAVDLLYDGAFATSDNLRANFITLPEVEGKKAGTSSSWVKNNFSGDTKPTFTASGGFWYDTLQNKIKRTTDKGETFDPFVCSFPYMTCYGKTTDAIIDSIEQVFNGMGYIGSTIWVDKGVKALIPDGRHEDGTLRNIEMVTSKISMAFEGSVAPRPSHVLLSPEGVLSMRVNNNTRYFDSDKNYFIVDNEINKCCIIATQNHDDTTAITSFYPKQPFRAVDYNDAGGLGMPSNRYIDLTLGASDSTYIAPANGWFYLAKQSGATQKYCNIYNTKSVPKGAAYVGMTNVSTASQLQAVYIPVSKGDCVHIVYNSTGVTERFTFVYAEGEI